MLSADETRRDMHLHRRHAGCHHMYVSCGVASQHTMQSYELLIFRGGGRKKQVLANSTNVHQKKTQHDQRNQKCCVN